MADEGKRGGSPRPPLDELERLFALSDDLLAVAGLDGYFRYVNPAFTRTFGHGFAELMRRPFMDFLHPEDRPAAEEALARLAAGTTVVELENRFLCADGSERWIAWKGMRDEGDERIYGIGRDVTERRRSERLKDEFISTVNHELRTPLTSIRGAMGLVSGGVAGALSSRTRELVDVALRNVDRLTRLVDDILDIDKIASGTALFRRAAVDVAALVRQAVEANEGLACERDVEMIVARMPADVTVIADPDRLMQVMTNLLSNAVKYSPIGGFVETRVEVVDGTVRVSVTDQGPGIPPEFAPRVFEPFARADGSTTRREPGTGLGLHISRAIIERLGGTIGFEPDRERGASFHFELPRWQPRRGKDGSAPARVLVCEDDVDVANLLRIVLEQDGYAVDVVHDAASARKRLAEGDYEAMTLDIVLPDADGLALLGELRGRPATATLPVVMVSAWVDERRSSGHHGDLHVMDWVAKPIDSGRLLAAVRSAVAGASVADEA